MLSGDREVGRWGDGEMGRWGDRVVGSWGDGEISNIELSMHFVSSAASKNLKFVENQFVV